jgi:hypothetical protein
MEARKEAEPIYESVMVWNWDLCKYECVSTKIVDYDYDGTEFNDGYYYE